MEAQLTAQQAPTRVGWGETGVFKEVAAHCAAPFEPAAEQEEGGNPVSSFGDVISLAPNRAALLQSVEVVGLRDIRMLDMSLHLSRQYVEGLCGVAVARVNS